MSSALTIKKPSTASSPQIKSARPFEPLLSQLFPPPTPSSNMHISPRMKTNLSLKTSCRKKEEFIPFVQERNHMNRLIKPFDGFNTHKEKQLDKTWQLFDYKKYKNTVDKSRIALKKRKNHLTNILDIETEPSKIESSISATKQQSSISRVRTEEDEHSYRESFQTGFRVKHQAPEKHNISLKKSARYFLIRDDPRGDRLNSAEMKPNAFFTSSTRDRLEELRRKPLSGVPEVGHYDVDNYVVVKPNSPAKTITRTPHDRGMTMPKTDHQFNIIYSSFDPDLHHQLVPDFSKQMKRNLVTEKTKVMHLAKDVEQMEIDFKFANYLRNKYDVSTTRPHKSVEYEISRLPVSNSKLNDTRKNIMLSYNLRSWRGGEKEHDDK